MPQMAAYRLARRGGTEPRQCRVTALYKGPAIACELRLALARRL